MSCLKENTINVDLISDSSIQKYVSVDTPINEKYRPNDLEKVSTEYVTTSNIHTLMLRKEANKAIDMMGKAFTKEFEDDKIEIISAYRDSKEQQTLYEEKGKKEEVAQPNTSEHQLGLAIDIRIQKKSWRKVSLDQESIFFNRLKNNAHMYGFHNSYQKGKEIDNIKKEWWHRRYLGKELATILANNNISFTEYYKRNIIL